MDVALETVSEVVSYKDKKELTQILPETWCLKKERALKKKSYLQSPFLHPYCESQPHTHTHTHTPLKVGYLSATSIPH